MSDNLRLGDYRPRSMLRVAEHPIDKPRFPVIDMHNHTVSRDGSWQVEDPAEIVAVMDAAGIAAMVDLDGGTGDQLAQHIERFRGPYPDRFAIFARCRWEQNLSHKDFGERAAKDLAQAVRGGAEGLKIAKTLGLAFKDPSGKRLRVNDERLDPLWQAAADLKVPVLIHSADPIAFFEPLDAQNELYEALLMFPDWHVYGPGRPSFEEVHAEMVEVIARHPRTRFIGAHVASISEDLARAGELLDRFPNLLVDIAARTPELGRKPYSTHDFLVRYAGRVVFGLDWQGPPEDYRVMYRMLETRDEYFSYASDPDGELGSDGRWRIYGADLPDEALRDLYYGTALTLLPRLKTAVDAMRGKLGAH
jgi:predicted TIM-barrel fold metal-dependent hydrolase